MADTKISALSAVSGALAAQEIPVNDAGTTKKLTVAQLAAYAGNGGLYNSNTTATGAGFASDTYLSGSVITIPPGLQAGSIYKCLFYATKTAAGVAAPVLTIRYGTAGTTADASRCALTFTAQTAAIDTGMFEVEAIFRSVGSGTSAVIVGIGKISHALPATGFTNVNNGLTTTVGGGFDSTVASSKIGMSVNGGASAAWIVNLVQAELRNVT